VPAVARRDRPRHRTLIHRRRPLLRARRGRALDLAAIAAAAVAGLACTGLAVAAGSRPSILRAPTISGQSVAGTLLRAHHGSWSHRPGSYSYAWRRCDRAGRRCRTIARANRASYRLSAKDIGHTLRVAVAAANGGGRSKAALSAHTSVVAAAAGGAPPAPVQHLEYVFDDGVVSVYDIDHAQQLVKTISLPQTSSGIRGVAVSPATHMLFVSYGGDGGGNGNGSVLAYDLVGERVVWSVRLNGGIDSGAVSPDGRLLYMPCGENCSSGIWNVLNTNNGAIVGKIQGGAGPHNTIASADGRYVYLGGRNHNYLGVYETASGSVREIGPLVAGVRPFTVNGSNTLAYTTATGFDGFQVSSVVTGKVLFTVPFGPVPGGFPFTAPSHGISLSPDERELYVIDSVHRQVQVYDVSRVLQGVAPVRVASISVPGFSGDEHPCAYDCGQDGWLQHSLDGRFVYVGDSGAVIETATRKAAAVLPTLANTRKTLEIDWSGGVPVATSTRSGVGMVG
jgi:WD40 repeat protein